MSEPLYRQIYSKYFLGPASHMVHRQNLESILTAGAIYSKNRMGTKPFVSIAYESVQELRSKVIVTCSGRQLHDYVPLYFGNRTPMIAALEKQNEDILFLRFSLDILELPGVVLTDGNAASSGTTFHKYTNLNSLEHLDSAAIRSVYYANDDEKKRRKQAELLVPDQIEIRHVFDIVCYSESARAAILSVLKDHGRNWSVNVNPGTWYFRTPSKG
jgi:hypothetical protein